MKKLAIALLMAASMGVAQAANFVSFDVDQVKDSKTDAKSTAQYFRAGKDMAGFNLGVQVRTAVFDNGGMLNSIETTVGKDIVKGLNTFVGIGYDNGFNGAKNGSFQYGLVGASTGTKVGPFWGYAGVKTRVNWDNDNPKQTVTFAGLSYPLNKHASLNAGWSKSFQDIKEDAWGLGIRFGF
jgi:hypothetical protein